MRNPLKHRFTNIFYNLAPGTRKSHRGFSLAEVTMMMLVLSVVSVPMLMMLNLQKVSIQQTQTDTQNRATVAQLFDNVNPQVADPINAYTVTGFPNALQPTNYYSVYCDPENKIAPAEGACTTSTNPLSSLQGSAPFFTRTISYAPNYKALTVTINLYKKSTISGNSSAYYSETRQYDLSSYHVYTSSADISYTTSGPTTSCAAGSALTSCFEGNNLETDASGNMWYPEILLPNATSSIEPYSYYSYYSTTPNTPSTNSDTSTFSPLTSGIVSANSIPFNNYRLLTGGSTSSPTKAYYNFKVTPNTKYDVNVYFSIPKGVSIGSGCLTGTQGTSCALADVQIMERPLCNSLSAPVTCSSSIASNTYLKQFSNYDVVAATGLTSGTSYTQGSILHATIKTQPESTSVIGEEIQVIINATSYINSTSNNSGINSATSAYVSGIEVLRRPDS